MNSQTTNSAMASVFHNIIADQNYLNNLDWGKPRRGHPEGTVRAHIEELESNLATVKSELNDDEYWKLRVLIHVHDSFKANSASGVAITDPRSHASLAASFFATHSDDSDLHNMVQFHDEPYALWRQARNRGSFNQQRLNHLIETIDDWRLFLRFTAIDGITDGKSPEPLYWAAENIASRVGLESEAVGFINKLTA